MLYSRRQLPVYSPLTLAAVARSATGHTAGAVDPAEALALHLRERYAADGVVLCASATHALSLAIGEGRRRMGGEAPIALPAYSCYDVATAAVGADARVALYDLDPLTLAPDLDDLERLLATGVRVVVIAPLYGIPVDWEELSGLADRYGALLIEDAAQCHGASWQGRPLGSLGALSVLSFGRGKGWTGGQGGALLIRGADGDSASVAGPSGARGSDVGVLVRVAAQWALGQPSVYGIPASLPWLALGETRYREPTPPAPISPVAATLLMNTAREADEEALVRRTNGRWLYEATVLQGHAWPVLTARSGVAGYLRLPLRLRAGMGSFSDAAMAARLGVAAGYPAPLSVLPAVRGRLALPRDRWPGADEIVRTLVTLPTHSRLAPADREGLVRLVEGSAGTHPPAPPPDPERPTLAVLAAP